MGKDAIHLSSARDAARREHEIAVRERELGRVELQAAAAARTAGLRTAHRLAADAHADAAASHERAAVRHDRELAAARRRHI